jgi:FtsP/CotA-like multicopper oxidase with cupredoxin domain
MSTHWFHDHMIDFTSQNVYKGNAAMMNLYSAVDRGNEAINDGVNLRLPSGSDKSWGNLDYDVNLVVADKAWDKDGQLLFDIFNFDGFLGDMMTVNFAYKPYFEVERRKYRFRILNAGVARYIQLGLSDNAPFWMIANDGNLLAQPVVMRELPMQGIAERYDIVIDFSKYPVGWKVWMVNLLEHDDGRGPKGKLSLRDALSGKSGDPCVGKILEFRITKNPSKPDVSQVPAQMIPLPERKPVVRERTFEFGRSGGSDSAPWTIKVDGGAGLNALMSRVSAAPQPNTAEIWHLINGGGGWDHPVHIHFEEGQILARNGSAANVPAWERGARKDVYRLGEGGSVTVYLQFREFMGTYMEHCHNTTHEDHAMLLRWDINGGLVPMPTPVPTPTGVTYLASTTLDGQGSSGSGSSGSGSSSSTSTTTTNTTTTTSTTTSSSGKGKRGRR